MSDAFWGCSEGPLAGDIPESGAPSPSRPLIYDGNGPLTPRKPLGLATEIEGFGRRRRYLIRTRPNRTCIDSRFLAQTARLGKEGDMSSKVILSILLCPAVTVAAAADPNRADGDN